MIQAGLHAELSELIDDLAKMGRLVGQLMINASAALLRTDLALAELVIARTDEMDVRHQELEQRCRAQLSPQLPVTADQQVVVAAWHAVRDIQRMGNLAQHVAKCAQLTDLDLPLLPDDVRTVIAQMSLLASGLAAQAATAIENLDPLAGDRLTLAGDEVDELRGQLFNIVFAENWFSGPESAARIALIGHYYECFTDHAVAVARQVGNLAADRVPQPPRPLENLRTGQRQGTGVLVR